MAKVKNYNLNVTEGRDSDFKNTFLGIFIFTVGILFMTHKLWAISYGPYVPTGPTICLYDWPESYSAEFFIELKNLKYREPNHPSKVLGCELEEFLES